MRSDNKNLNLSPKYVDLLKQIHTETMQWNFHTENMVVELLELGYCYIPRPNYFSQNPILTLLGLKAIGLGKEEKDV